MTSRRIKSHVTRVGQLLGRRVTFGNHRFSMPGYYASRLPNADDEHEAYMVAVVRRVLASSPGAFVDVGVNIARRLPRF